MATTINAGRVRFVSRGTYNNSTQYYLFDLVDYNGSSYIAKENIVGILPTNTQYWQLVAEKGNIGNDGPQGPTGNGIQSIRKTGTDGLVDTYTITFTNGSTTTFTVTNGEDGEVTETELDVLRQKVADQQMVINQLPQVSGSGTEITLNNTIEAPMTQFDVEGNSTQETTQGSNYLDNAFDNQSSVGAAVSYNDDGSLTISGTSISYFATFLREDLSQVLDGTYTLICKIISGSFSGGNIRFSLGNSQMWGATDSSANRLFSVGVTPSTTNGVVDTQTVNDTLNRYAIYINSGITFNNLKLKLYLVKGTYTISNIPTYEKYTYGASPNPNYEQPIYSAGDDVNLFDKDNANIIKGFISTGSSNTIASSNNSRTLYLGVNPNTSYTIQKKSSNYFRVGETSEVPTVGSTVTNFYNGTRETSYTITTSVTGQYIVLTFWTNADTLTEQEILDSIKIQQGSVATPYSPYEMGSITEKIINKNWLNPNDFILGEYNERVGATGAIRASSNAWMTWIPMKDGETYKFTGDLSSITSNVVRTFVTNDKVKIGTIVTRINNLGNNNTYTNTDNYKYLVLEFLGVTSYKEEYQWQVTKGSTATTYTPHEEQTYTIPTQQPFRSIGDVRDEFDRENKLEKHPIYRMIFDGTEGWRSNGDYWSIYNVRQAKGNSLKSNYLSKNISWNTASGNGFMNGTTILIAKATFDFTEVEELKTWLAEKYANGNPMYIDYILATPTDLPCTEEQITILETMPYSDKEQTNIYSLDETPAFVEAKGLYDLNNLINS